MPIDFANAAIFNILIEVFISALTFSIITPTSTWNATEKFLKYLKIIIIKNIPSEC